jgi:hypothetical protein
MYGQQSFGQFNSTNTPFFTNPNSTTSASSFFAKPTTTETNYLGGFQTISNQQLTPGFFKQPETTSTSSFFNKPTSSFGTTPSTGSMLNTLPSTTNQSTICGTTGFGHSSSLSQMYNTSNLTQLQNRKDTDKQEILHIISNYINAISTQSFQNQFKLMVYNRIEPRQQSFIRQFQEYKQKQTTLDGREQIFVDFNLWNSALQKNPNPALYYPFQLNGPKSLLLRASITNNIQRHIFEYIIDYQKKINNCRSIYDVEIQDNLINGKKKLAEIKKCLIKVISKLEKLAIYSKRGEKEYNTESNILQRYNQIKSSLIENDSIVQHLEDVSSKTSFINQFSRRDFEKDNLTKEKFEKNLMYFKELKNVFDTTYETLNNDFSVLSFIQNDLENSKKYGINNY